MITNATFGRTARDIVLHAIAFKNFRLAAIHAHRNRNYQLSLRAAQHVAQRLFQIEIIRRAIELLLGNLKWIQFFLHWLRCSHECFPRARC